VYTLTDRLARGLWGAWIAWQVRRPSYGGLRRCAQRGALASQSPTLKVRAPNDRHIYFAVIAGRARVFAIFKD